MCDKPILQILACFISTDVHAYLTPPASALTISPQIYFFLFIIRFFTLNCSLFFIGLEFFFFLHFWHMCPSYPTSSLIHDFTLNISVITLFLSKEMCTDHYLTVICFWAFSTYMPTSPHPLPRSPLHPIHPFFVFLWCLFLLDVNTVNYYILICFCSILIYMLILPHPLLHWPLYPKFLFIC